MKEKSWHVQKHQTKYKTRKYENCYNFFFRWYCRLRTKCFIFISLLLQHIIITHITCLQITTEIERKKEKKTRRQLHSITRFFFTFSIVFLSQMQYRNVSWKYFFIQFQLCTMPLLEWWWIICENMRKINQLNWIDWNYQKWNRLIKKLNVYNGKKQKIIIVSLVLKSC